jgi:DNA-binding beta-propeller fold protein YncE
MKHLIAAFALCSAAAVPALASPVTYEVLNRGTGIIGVPADGGPGTIIPFSFPAYGFAREASGDYVVAAVSSLMRVKPTGERSVIATAPTGSQLLSVAIDAAGNFIVADNDMHRILRISADGASITPVATYPVVIENEAEDVHVRINAAGDYVLAEDNENLHLFTITPGGVVTPVPLTGNIPQLAGGMTIDPAGNYIVTSFFGGSVLSITPGGVISTLTSGPGLSRPTGIARDPVSGNFIVTDIGNNTLWSISADGSTMSPIRSGFSYPVDVIIVPEPSSLSASLLAVGAAALLRQRRRHPAKSRPA